MTTARLAIPARSGGDPSSSAAPRVSDPWRPAQVSSAADDDQRRNDDHDGRHENTDGDQASDGPPNRVPLRFVGEDPGERHVQGGEQLPDRPEDTNHADEGRQCGSIGDRAD